MFDLRCNGVNYEIRTSNEKLDMSMNCATHGTNVKTEEDEMTIGLLKYLF